VPIDIRARHESALQRAAYSGSSLATQANYHGGSFSHRGADPEWLTRSLHQLSGGRVSAHIILGTNAADHRRDGHFLNRTARYNGAVDVCAATTEPLACMSELGGRVRQNAPPHGREVGSWFSGPNFLLGRTDAATRLEASETTEELLLARHHDEQKVIGLAHVINESLNQSIASASSGMGTTAPTGTTKRSTRGVRCAAL
jgi:hypothetical protein